MFKITSQEEQCGQSSTKILTNHPKIMNTLELLNECNVIKYAAYRTAAKVRELQKAFHMEHVRLGLIACVFHKHLLQASENEVLLERAELEAVLSDIFFAAQKETLNSVNVEVATDQMMNLLFCIYQGQETATIQAIAAKVALAVLSCAPLQEKYQYFFHQLVDHNNCISRKKMELLLAKLTQITEYLSESFSFGANLISSTVDSCFQQSQGTLGVTEDAFLGWLLQGPQLLVWLSILYRMQTAETVSHAVKCAVCKTFPIIGFRYQCLVCIKYNQCQKCFLTARLSRRHKLMHSTQEYCCQTTSKETTKAFLKALKHKLWCNSSKPLHHIPAEPVAADHSDGIDDLSTRTLHPEQELQSIICHLEEENRRLEKLSGEGGRKVGACLQDHRALIEAQLHRLRLLKRYLERVQESNTMSHGDIVKPIAGETESKHSMEVGGKAQHNFHLSHGSISRVGRPLIDHLESTPVVPMAQRVKLCTAPSISPIIKETHNLHVLSWQTETTTSPSERTVGDLSTRLCADNTTGVFRSSTDLSSWLHGPGRGNRTVEEMHGDLDSIVERLQKLLASNLTLEEAFNCKDNAQLQMAATEVEDLVTGLIEGVQQRKKESISGRQF